MKKMIFSLAMIMSFSAISAPWILCKDAKNTKLTISTPDYFGFVTIMVGGKEFPAKLGYESHEGYADYAHNNFLDRFTNEKLLHVPGSILNDVIFPGLAVGTKFELMRTGMHLSWTEDRKLLCQIETLVPYKKI